MKYIVPRFIESFTFFEKFFLNKISEEALQKIKIPEEKFS